MNIYAMTDSSVCPSLGIGKALLLHIHLRQSPVLFMKIVRAHKMLIHLFLE